MVPGWRIGVCWAAAGAGEGERHDGGRSLRALGCAVENGGRPPGQGHHLHEAEPYDGNHLTHHAYGKGGRRRGPPSRS
jgi:hypothetical protein